MEIKSNEILNASVRSADPLTQIHQALSVADIKKYVETYVGQKDLSLIKHFDHSFSITTSSATPEELINNILKCIRMHYIMQIRATDVNSHERIIILDKVFDSIKTMFEILSVHEIKVSKNDLLAALIGNMLKSLS